METVVAIIGALFFLAVFFSAFPAVSHLFESLVGLAAMGGVAFLVISLLGKGMDMADDYELRKIERETDYYESEAEELRAVSRQLDAETERVESHIEAMRRKAAADDIGGRIGVERRSRPMQDRR